MQPKRTLKPKLRTTLPRSLYQATQHRFTERQHQDASQCVQAAKRSHSRCRRGILCTFPPPQQGGNHLITSRAVQASATVITRINRKHTSGPSPHLPLNGLSPVDTNLGTKTPFHRNLYNRQTGRRGNTKTGPPY